MYRNNDTKYKYQVFSNKRKVAIEITNKYNIKSCINNK